MFTGMSITAWNQSHMVQQLPEFKVVHHTPLAELAALSCQTGLSVAGRPAAVRLHISTQGQCRILSTTRYMFVVSLDITSFNCLFCRLLIGLRDVLVLEFLIYLWMSFFNIWFCCFSLIWTLFSIFLLTKCL